MFHSKHNDPPSHIENQCITMIDTPPTCPRCCSSNTKFCYYNNYSLSQPRYFCKACRRYWTKGGCLRNVPVGGGCRKNRRSKSSLKPTRNSHPYSRDLKNELYEDEPRPDLDIDLAVVFNNFLNRNPSRVEPGSVRQRVSDQDEANNALISHSGISSNSFSEAVEGNDIGDFGEQNLVGDCDYGHDVFWSDVLSQSEGDLREIPWCMNVVNNDTIWSSF